MQMAQMVNSEPFFVECRNSIYISKPELTEHLYGDEGEESVHVLFFLIKEEKNMKKLYARYLTSVIWTKNLSPHRLHFTMRKFCAVILSPLNMLEKQQHYAHSS